MVQTTSGLRASSIDDPFGENSHDDLEEGMNDITLSPPLPQEDEDDGDIGQSHQEEDEGDIGAHQSPSPSPSPSEKDRPPVDLQKELPDSPERTPTVSVFPHTNGVHQSQASTSSQRSDSRPLSPSGSPIRTPSSQRTSYSGTNLSRHQSRSSFSKPVLPTGRSIFLNDEDDAANLTPTDGSGRFESIPISTTPPPPSVPLPSTPKSLHINGNGNGKRGSWGGFGVSPSGERIAYGTPPTHDHESRRSSVASGSGSSSPHLSAPPAHPHPFPLPTSPVQNTKRLSTTSNRSSTSQAHGQHTTGIGVKGVSTFEKVISQTRPSWLPPKPKEEDEHHYHQWSEMMTQSKEAEQQRQKRLEVHRLDKERKLAISTPQWESLLSSPDFSPSKVQNDPTLRQMWFEGIPPRLRGKAWSLVIGNPLALSKDVYKSYDRRAKKAIESGRFPADVLEKLERELDETLVTLKLFQRGGAMRDELRELVCAWVVYRSDEGLGYAPYITLPSAMLLLTSPPAQAFHTLLNLLSRPCLSAFYKNHIPDIDAFYRVFENLQADLFPKIYANCKNLGIRLPESWFRSLLVEQVPFEVACRLWDQIVLDGDGYIFRAALAIFGFLEPRLHYPDHDEIQNVLQGTSKATQAIISREQERAKLRGETWTGVDGKMSAFGLDEGALFGWLEGDGWKESRFVRLVQRELPD